MSDPALSSRAKALFCALGTAVILGAAGAVAAATAQSGGGATYTATFGHAGSGLDTRSDVKVRAITRTTDPSDPSDTAEPLYRATRAIDPQDIATLMRTLSQGLSGEGPALRRSVGNGAKVIDATYADRARLRQLLGDLTGLSSTFENRGGTITRATRDFNDLSTLATTQPDKVTLLLDRAGALSTQVGGTLGGHGANLGRLLDGTGRAASTVAAQNGNLPVLADSLNGFFSGLAGVMTAPGPSGTHPAVLRGTLALDVCRILVDLCPVG